MLVNVIRPKNFAGRSGFWQHVDNAIGPFKGREYDVIEESYRDIDAAIGNAFVICCRSAQSLQTVFLFVGSNHSMHGDGVVVIHPKYFISM